MDIDAKQIQRPGIMERIRNMFNLNDSRWGRGADGEKGDAPQGDKPPSESGPTPPPAGNNQGQNGGRKGSGQSGPPDLDEMWADFNRKLSGLFGGGSKGGAPRGGGGNGPGPDMKNAGVGVGLIAAIAVMIWMGTGFFIVQEGQQAVITQFGSYKTTVNAGFNWRLPYPIQRHEVVSVTQLRSVNVGMDKVLAATGLKESAMLTQDENILDIKFAVQYRLSDAREYLFESKDPEAAVVQAAETAVREVIGGMKMDDALSEARDQIAPRVLKRMQDVLVPYKVGIEVVAINLQQGGVRPPEQVQAAFDDVLKAGQERERTKNEAQTYANEVIPRAVGSASRLKAEAEAYKARVVAQAEGDAQRFRSVFAEYQKAPQVTRDRMYLDAMQQIYANVTKVVVESRQGSSLLYLPLEKLLQAGGNTTATTPVAPVADPAAQLNAGNAAAAQQGSAGTNDARSRDAARTRERDSR